MKQRPWIQKDEDLLADLEIEHQVWDTSWRKIRGLTQKLEPNLRNVLRVLEFSEVLAVKMFREIPYYPEKSVSESVEIIRSLRDQ